MTVVRAASALLAEARPLIDKNLAGLTDEEYLWEPVADCWSVRRRGDIRSPDCWGRDAWVVEVSADGSVEPAITTIAWRLMHAYDCTADFASRAFGGPGHDWNDIEVAADATTAVAMMTAALDDLRAALAEGENAVLAGVDPFFQRPRSELLVKALHEAIHHCAEIGIMRSFWRANQPGSD